jgi:hypothetical protein
MDRNTQDRGPAVNSGPAGKRPSVGLILKVVLVGSIFAAVFFLIYFAVQYGEANFILSNQEITSEDSDSVASYKVNDKVYFYINRKMKSLDANLFIMEIEYFEKGEYRHYKQISYELEKEFPKISSYVPSEYFSRAGKYRIKASLDGKLVATGMIEVSQ